ncbi:MAG: single-stranded-DNA-specific exonuclease RecJ [Lactobacillales bacterium]|jgi:single-stranded-DNA-specific exonuclease|nr:single-stranded-DNA-specific exonuclease RecJ [Lactobacillales bacterium]
MKKSKYHWQVITLPKGGGLADQISAHNGLKNPDATLEDMNDPFLLTGMDEAVERILAAVENEERIYIYGDYDCDGITSTVILLETLRELGAENVDYYIPNRFLDGYGPSMRKYEEIAPDIDLLITVDNGVSGLAEVAYLKEHGVDVILTDHHELPAELPAADVIIHTHLSPDYPDKTLAGVGVAFKLAWGLLGEFPENALDLLAIGTVADMVSLLDENRIFVKYGIKALRKTKRKGIKALLNRAGQDLATLNEETIGFTIGPRINAVGRLLENPGLVVDFLMSDDDEAIETTADLIEATNKERQRLVEEMADTAEKMVEPTDPLIIVWHEGWGEGLCGLVASRLMQKFSKPTIVLTIKYDIAKGSARSFEPFDLFASLTELKPLFEKVGGHALAAGMSIKVENLETLKQEMFKLAEKVDLSEGLGKDVIEINLEDIDVKLIESLDKLAPFGMDNPKIEVLTRDVTASNIKIIGQKRNHLKMQLGSSVSALAWNEGENDYEFTSSNLDVVGKLSVNEWNSVKSAQLIIEDYKIDGVQFFDFRSKARKAQLQKIDTSDALVIDKPQLVNVKDYDRVFITSDPRIPTRDEFNNLYKFLSEHKKLDKQGLLDASQQLRIDLPTLSAMINIFYELNVAKKGEGYAEFVGKPTGKFEETPTYKLLDLFKYHPISEIKEELNGL